MKNYSISRLTVGSVIAIFLSLIFSYSYVMTRSNMPPPGNTGAPGETTCARSGCHSGSAIFDTTVLNIGTIPLGALDAGYVPGTQYNITVTFNASSPRYGFELTALDSLNNMAGSFTITDSNNTSHQIQGGRSYMGHKSASSISAWTFKWTAPLMDVGDITFYSAGNKANGNNQPTGDQIYTSIKTIHPVSTVGVVGIDESGITLNTFPNPAIDKIWIQINTSSSSNHTVFNLYDLNGTLIKQLFNGDTHNWDETKSFELPHGLQKGMYLLDVQCDKAHWIVKQLIY